MNTGAASPLVVNLAHAHCPDWWWVVTPDNNSGGVFRDIVHSSHLSLKNATQGPTCGWSSRSHIGGFGSLRFDGTITAQVISQDEHLDRQSNTNIEQARFTICMWINTTDPVTASNVLISDYNRGTSGGWLFYLNTTSKGIGFGEVNAALSAGRRSQGAIAVNDGLWHHIAITSTGNATATTLLYYVDGVLDSTSNIANTAGTSYTIGNLMLGNTAGTAGFPYTGLMDDVRIYRKQLGIVEIKRIMKNSMEGYPGLLLRDSKLGTSSTATFSQSVALSSSSGFTRSATMSASASRALSAVTGFSLSPRLTASTTLAFSATSHFAESSVAAIPLSLLLHASAAIAETETTKMPRSVALSGASHFTTSETERAAASLLLHALKGDSYAVTATMQRTLTLAAQAHDIERVNALLAARTALAAIAHLALTASNSGAVISLALTLSAATALTTSEKATFHTALALVAMAEADAAGFVPITYSEELESQFDSSSQLRSQADTTEKLISQYDSLH